jgi:quercetin dioxygenase-like cupin family protein
MAHPKFAAAAVVLALALSALATSSPADEAPRPKMIVKVLMKTTVSGDETREAIVGTAEFPPGASTGRHTHPGDEYATVLEGELEIVMDGQPTRHVKAGEAYHNERDVVHETRNPGMVAAKVVSTFVITKGQPISKPVGGA